MSLINQVLRDLDQRRAAPAAASPAVRTTPASRSRRGAWMVIAGVATLGIAASAVAWSSLGSRPAPTMPAPSAPVAAAPAPLTPVVVVTAPAPVAAPSPASPASSTSQPRMEPRREPASDLRVAVAAPTAPKPIARDEGAPVGEPRIEKRAPSRTARERADAAYQRGVAAHQQGQLDDAAAAYAAALREEPSLASAREALAGVLIAQGRADDAQAVLVEGVARTPQHTGLALMLARLLAERGELQRAAGVLEGAPITSASAEEHALRAAILQRLGRHAEAAEGYATALRTTPNQGVWWMGLGISLAAEGRNGSAREAFSRARATGTLAPELGRYVEQRLRQLL